MTPLVPLALAAALLAAPLHAQEEEPSLLEQGRDLLLRGLAEEVVPPLGDLAAPLGDLGGIAAEYLPTFAVIAQEMGPAFVEVFGQIDSIANYEAPEFLPNGDILLRRSPGAPDWTPPEAEPGAEGAAPDSAPPEVEL